MKRRRGDVVDTLLGSPGVTIDALLDAVAGAIEAGAFPVPGAVRSGELVTACRRSPRIRAMEHRLLEQTLERLVERIESDQRHTRVRNDVDPKALALLLLLAEAGAELLLDLRYPFDARCATNALRRLLAFRNR
jgi:hypothetical protein